MTGHIDKSPADIANGLRKIASDMMDIATDLDYYGGMDSRMVSKAQGMIAASAVVIAWANEIENKS